LNSNLAQIAKHSKPSKDPTVDSALENGDPTRIDYNTKPKAKHRDKHNMKKRKLNKVKHRHLKAKHVMENKASNHPPNQNQGANNNPPPTNPPAQQVPQNPGPNFGFPFFKPIPLWYTPPAGGQPMGLQNPSLPGGLPSQNMKQLENTYFQFGNALQGLRNAQNSNLNNAQHVTYAVPYLRQLEGLYSTINNQLRYSGSTNPYFWPQYGMQNPQNPYLLSDLNSIYPFSDPLHIFRFLPQLTDYSTRYADLLNVLYRSQLNYRNPWLAHQFRLSELNERMKNLKPPQHVVVHHTSKPDPTVHYVVRDGYNAPQNADGVRVVIDNGRQPPSDDVQYIVHSSTSPLEKSIKLEPENGQPQTFNHAESRW